MAGSARRLLAEFAGTFLLVFGGCGAIAVDDLSGGELGHVGSSLAFGLAIAAGVFTLGHVSGAHFNPAISGALALIGRFPVREIAPYVLAQVAGAASASLVLRGLYGNVADLGATAPAPA
ncbi:MAG: aquaporin [Dehalococcoidia bacterium]